MIERCAAIAVAGSALSLAAPPLRAGHGIVFTPSHYPHEITIDTLDPAAAALQLQKSMVHAYVGSMPRFAAGAPKDLKPRETLRAFLVLGVNPARKAFQQREERCSAARAIFAALGGRSGAPT